MLTVSPEEPNIPCLPSYSVATNLPTYEEAERSKQEEEARRLREEEEQEEETLQQVVICGKITAKRTNL